MGYPLQYSWASPVAQLAKNLPAIQKTAVRFLGREEPPGEGMGYPLQYSWASFVAQLVKNPPTMRETWFDPWVGKRPLEKGKATHSSILAWRMGHQELETSEQLSLSLQFSAQPPSSHTKKGSPGLQNFCFLKISKPVTSLKSFLQTKFTFILFVWNLIIHWSGEDGVSQKA